MLGVNWTSPVVGSVTAMAKVRPLHALHVPVPAPEQQANGLLACKHTALLPPVPVADTEKTPGSMFVPTQIDADASPQEGVCLMLLNVTFPVFCGALEVFWMERLTGIPVFPTWTSVGYLGAIPSPIPANA